MAASEGRGKLKLQNVGSADIVRVVEDNQQPGCSSSSVNENVRKVVESLVAGSNLRLRGTKRAQPTQRKLQLEGGDNDVAGNSEGVDGDVVQFVREEVEDPRDRIEKLSIFPQEIWVAILKKIKDPNDLESLSNASPYFRNLLLGQRTLFLFPKVFEILEKKCPDQRLFYGDEIGPAMKRRKKSTRICRSCGRERYGDIFFAWILNLRGVCKTWSNAVDHLYQVKRAGYQYRMGEFDYRFGDKEDEDEWTRDNEVEEQWYREIFTKHFRRTHGGKRVKRSPFFGRSIMLAIPFSDEDDEESEIVAFLKLFVRHVWYCTIETDHYQDADAYHKLIKEWLALMPNLKVLNMSGAGVLEEDSEELRSLVASKPLPKLKNLEFLYASNVQVPVLNELIRQNGHVSMLELIPGDDTGDYDIGTLPVTNLKQLRIGYFDGPKTSLWSKLNNLQATWPLEKLDLNFADSGPYIEWQEIFTLIQNKWQDTLTDVLIFLPKVKREEDEAKIMEECHSFKLDLPKVNRFKVCMSSPSTLDFILPMKNTLEFLYVVVYYDIDERMKEPQVAVLKDKQQIQFLGYTEKFHEMILDSNIWTLFPKLKRIDLKKSYVRKAEGDLAKWPEWMRSWSGEDEATRGDWEKKMEAKKKST